MSDEGQRQPPTINCITQTSPVGHLPSRPQDDQDQAYELQLEDDQQEEDSRSEGSVEDQDQEENSNSVGSIEVGGDQEDEEEKR